MAFSDYLANNVLDEIYNQGDFTPPSSLYVALYTDDPGDDDTGTEVDAPNYNRQECTTAFSAASSRSVENDTEILFAEAGESWGLVTHVGIRDAATGGNLLDHGALPVEKQVDEGDQLRLKPGDIVSSLS